MNAHRPFKTCALCFALTLPVFAAGPALLVDRGLPRANLNNASGDYRSNVRWSAYDGGFLGDDFTVGALGESWVIDTIRVWTVPGVSEVDPDHLGDFYQDVRLYFGGSDESISPVVTGLLKPGADQTSNPNILISDSASDGEVPYDDFGTNMRVWQIDFTRLNLAVQGGVRLRFAAWGLGRSIPNKARSYAWFNAASNAELAGARQDGADGAMLMFTSGGEFKSVFDGKGAGWDKTSDINVEVFGHRLEETAKR